MGTIERGLAKLRREQSARVMPRVGALLDAWDGTPNDERGLLERDFPNPCEHIRGLQAAIYGDDDDGG
jgi:hypothetical protein